MKVKVLVLSGLIAVLVLIGCDVFNGGFAVGGGIQIGGQIYQGQMQIKIGKMQPEPEFIVKTL